MGGIVYLNQNHLFSRVKGAGAGLWGPGSTSTGSEQGRIRLSAISRSTWERQSSSQLVAVLVKSHP